MDSTPDPSTGLLVEIIFLVILILINAFFASSEMAFVSVNKTKIKLLAQEGNKKAKLLLDLLDQPNKFLSTIQVAITLAGFLASASAATALADDLGVYLDGLGVPYSFQISVVALTLLLSFFTLVFGELFPKRVALLKAESIALHSIGIILFVSKITTPFVWLLSKSVTLLMKITGQKENENADEYSEEEIKSILEVGQETGFLKETGKEMIASIFEFDDKLAYEVMTPRTDVYMIDVNEPITEYLDEMLEERFSRIPVYEKDTDNIIGILYMKDFILEARRLGFEAVEIRNLIKKPYLVPESKNIDDLFKDMQSTKNHISILIDEYGGVAGIVTIEDLVEEVMGNIDDEHDHDEPKVEKIDENTYLIDGQYYIDDLNDELGLILESEEHETVGGLIIDYLGEIPDDNDNFEGDDNMIVEIENCVFKVVSVKDQRIERLKLYVAPKNEENLDDLTPVSE